MKQHSNTKYIQISLTLLYLVLFAKVVSVIALWFLPSHSVDARLQNSLNMPYMLVNFHNMLENTKKISQTAQYQGSDNTVDINTLILTALYGQGSYGYVIVALKKHPRKTTLLSVGESYQGYKLKAIFLNYALFSKMNRNYKLRLNPSSASQDLVHPVMSQSTEHIIQRTQINSYVHNPSDIWRDISIQQVGTNGSFKGFRVTRIRRGTPFALLGLRVGDLIVKANNIALKSYNDVLKIYQNLNKLNALTLVVKRGNTEKDIVYEID